uniref:Uncharacterized protein n=1 Tax=Anopheles albimanus TaxID=7167 RepID=A0A182FZB3_ANOAL
MKFSILHFHQPLLLLLRRPGTRHKSCAALA